MSCVSRARMRQSRGRQRTHCVMQMCNFKFYILQELDGNKDYYPAPLLSLGEPLKHETSICTKLLPPLIRNFATQLQQQQILSLEICQKIAEKLVRSLQILSILAKFDQIARPLSGKWVWQTQDKVSSSVLGPSWMISFDKRGRHLEDKRCGFRSCHHVVYFTDFWKLSQNDQWFWSHC